MKPARIVVLWLLILTLFVGLFAVYFYETGGAGLSRIVFNYLISDLPDKRYGWNDFRYRGEGEKISGFYAYGDSESLSIRETEKIVLSSFFIQS